MNEITKAFIFSAVLCVALGLCVTFDTTDNGTVEPLETKITGTKENPIIIGNQTLQLLVIQGDSAYGVPYDN